MWYESEHHGIRVTVSPSFSLADSNTTEGTFAFRYHVAMQNHGTDTAQLLFRHWYVHDSVGEDAEVDGEGVIGQQPVLVPGSGHEYSSICVLSSPLGFMEGYYVFARPDGEEFRVPVPRFPLEGPFPLPNLSQGPTEH